jgi:hypothetical protein
MPEQGKFQCPNYPDIFVNWTYHPYDPSNIRDPFYEYQCPTTTIKYADLSPKYSIVCFCCATLEFNFNFHRYFLLSTVCVMAIVRKIRMRMTGSPLACPSYVTPRKLDEI